MDAPAAAGSQYEMTRNARIGATNQKRRSAIAHHPKGVIVAIGHPSETVTLWDCQSMTRMGRPHLT